MASESEKGGMTADIPAEAVEEALRSVEKRESRAVAGNQPAVEEEQPQGDVVESLRAQLNLSQEKGRETLVRLKEEHERYLRAVADLENYKKRAHKEREEIQKFGIEKLLKDLIPVLDNLERAIKAIPEGDPLASGVKLVQRTFEDALGRYGVKAFSAMGQPFDPRLHEALLEVQSDQPSGTVVLEHGRGYLLHERLARPSMVGVAVAPKGETSKDQPAEPPAQTKKGGANGGDTSS